MQIFIMAQGEGSRWENDIRNSIIAPAPFKWLIPVGQETVISRFLRQFPDATYVAKPEIAPNQNVITLKASGTIMDGILQTSHLWKPDERIVIILGDVIFSKPMIEKIYEDNTNWAFYGRRNRNLCINHDCGEIFGMTISPSQQEFAKSRMEIYRNSIGAKLWFLQGKCPEAEFIEIVGDWTDDIDSVLCYHAFGKDLVRLAENEV